MKSREWPTTSRTHDSLSWEIKEWKTRFHSWKAIVLLFEKECFLSMKHPSWRESFECVSWQCVWQCLLFSWCRFHEKANTNDYHSLTSYYPMQRDSLRLLSPSLFFRCLKFFFITLKWPKTFTPEKVRMNEIESQNWKWMKTTCTRSRRVKGILIWFQKEARHQEKRRREEKDRRGFW